MRPKVQYDYKMPNSMEELPLGPSSEAGVLTQNNAGWRVQYPVVNKEKCVKCRKCWILCPEGVIDKEIEIDMDFCKGCGICAEVCPKDAIHMVSEVNS